MYVCILYFPLVQTKEYANEYFLSGEVDLSLYEDDCVFADPFASFRGKERFKNNLSNLGLFITQSQARLLSLTVCAFHWFLAEM